MAYQDPRDLDHGSRGRGYARRVSLALPAWLGAPSPRLVDAGLAVLFAAILVLTGVEDGAQDDRAWLGVVVGVAAAVPLVFRRRWPFAVLAAILVVAFASPVNAAFELPLLLVLFTVGSQRSWEATFAAGAAVVGSALVYVLAGGPDLRPQDLVGLALECVVAAGLGLYVGSRRARIATLHERAERLDRERELLAERAVAEERVRIAQDLHDVVAHNVSLIVVQAQALGATVVDDRVADATDQIADLGRQAMTEMHRTLKLLRTDHDHATSRAPQPGLGDLDELLERARGAGLRVEVAVEGEPRRLAQSIDLSAFRIVQEALTNVVKHAARAHTTVLLGYRAEALELTIADDGDGAAATPGPPAGAADGHGIVGMRERAALFGGTLTARPRGDHGFEVHALLPYGEERGG